MSSPLTIIETGALLDPASGLTVIGRAIAVRDGIVEAILEPSEARPDPGAAETIDLRGLTALPGLIDCHAHLIGDIQAAGVPAIGATAAAELAAGEAHAWETLVAGVTTVRDVGTYRGLLDLQLRDRINLGIVPGPRMQCAGAMITRPRGGGEVTGDPAFVIPPEFRMGVVRDVVEVQTVVDRLIEAGAEVIKLIVTGAVLTVGTEIDDIELEAPLIRAAVETASKHGVHVAAHAHGAQGIRIAAAAGVRSVEHASLLDDDGIRVMLERGTFLVADVYDGDWIDEVGRRDGWPAETLAKNTATTEAQRSGFTRALRAGVRMAFGTDSGVYPHRFVGRQFPIMVRLGMTPLEVIQSTTTSAADLMGWSDRIGSLTPGHLADLIAVSGDPTVEIEHLIDPAVVLKAGRIVVDRRPIQAAQSAS
ncbi:MAG: amidohydrolase family protein [Chloroflexota bacterium]